MKILGHNFEFEPTLFIGVGAHNHYFTLRETYNHVTYEAGEHGNAVINGVYQGNIRSEVRSMHLKNLSQNAEEAFEKAMRYATMSGMVLKSTLEGIKQELDEIKRATAEEIERKEEERRQREAKWEAERQENRAQMMEVIKAGFFPCTKFQGIAFDKAERSFVKWIADSADQFEEDSLMRAVADELNTSFKELVAPIYKKDLHIGSVGERREFTVEVVRTISFETNWGWTTISLMREESGACLISKGSFFEETGSKMVIKATIKSHDEYKGQAQTNVQRIKKVKEL